MRATLVLIAAAIASSAAQSSSSSGSDLPPPSQSQAPRPLSTPYPTALPDPRNTILIAEYPDRNCQEHHYDHSVALKFMRQTNGQCMNYTTHYGTTLYYQLSLAPNGQITSLNYTCLHPQCHNCEFRWPSYNQPTATPSFKTCYVASNPDLELSIIVQSVAQQTCIGIAGTTNSGGLMAMHYRTATSCNPLMALETRFHDWGGHIYNNVCEQARETTAPIFRQVSVRGKNLLDIKDQCNSDCSVCNITFLGYDMTKEPCLNGPMVNGTSENMWQFRYMNQSEVCAAAITPTPSPSTSGSNGGAVAGALFGGIAVGAIAVFSYQYVLAKRRQKEYAAVAPAPKV